MTVPRGRRPGAPDTRAAILTVAREAFAAGGYAGTTVRGVAGAAGVDPALVHHYFGTKDDLFLAALEMPIDPRQVLGAVAAAGVPGAGERLMGAFVTVWDDEQTRMPLLALVRGITDPAGQRLLADGLRRLVLGPLGVALGLDHAERRVSMVASTLVGLVMVRYVLRMEPLASLPASDVVAAYAPVVQRWLEMPLG